MKNYVMMAVICGCLLVGSLYPRLLLDHHVRLVDENGREFMIEEYSEEIPFRMEFRFLKIFR